MSRAHLEQGRVRDLLGKAALLGAEGAQWGSGARQLRPFPIPDLGLAASASQEAAEVQPGRPAALVAPQLGERADPRVSSSEQGARCPLPRPRQHQCHCRSLGGRKRGRRLVRRLKARPGQSRSAQGPSGAEPRRGGGRAGRGVYGKRSLSGAWPGAGGSWVSEARGGRERRWAGRWRRSDPLPWPRTPGGGRAAARVGQFVLRCARAGVSGGGCSRVAVEAPWLARDSAAVPLWSRPRGDSEKGWVSQKITGRCVVMKRCFSANHPLFTKAGIPPVPGSS